MQITDEMVEAALDKWFDDDGEWKKVVGSYTEEQTARFVAEWRSEMRAALEAALAAAA